MKNDPARRQFINRSIKAGILFPVIGSSTFSLGSTFTDRKRRTKSLKILILGGTSFLGPHQVAYALERGHSVSIFTRGKSVPPTHREVFKRVEHLIGDRENNLEALRGKTWDVVIDNSGRRVNWTRDSAQLLKDRTSLYLYTSSTGVYYPYLESDIKEDTSLVREVPPNVGKYEKMEYDYGVMKTNSEIEARKAFGENRTIVVRPTYMMGPGDGSDRFTYWPLRLKKGGEVMIPGKINDPVQYIDVRDVAQWMVRLLEAGTAGTFNAVGPASETGMNAFVYGAHAAFSSSAKFVQIQDYAFLERHGVLDAVPWIMPTGNNFGSARVNNQLAVNNGLAFTPLANSVQDIIEWWNMDIVPESRKKALLSGDSSLMSREALILREWKSRW